MYAPLTSPGGNAARFFSVGGKSQLPSIPRWRRENFDLQSSKGNVEIEASTERLIGAKQLSYCAAFLTESEQAEIM